jgi:hypothetical protein
MPNAASHPALLFIAVTSWLEPLIRQLAARLRRPLPLASYKREPERKMKAKEKIDRFSGLSKSMIPARSMQKAAGLST